MLKTIVCLAAACGLLACSSAVPSLSPGGEGASQSGSAVTVCDLSKISGVFTVDDAFAGNAATCGAGGSIAFSDEYDLAEGVDGCTGPGGHTQAVSADGCTLTEVCNVAGAKAARVTLVATYTADLSSMSGTLTSAPVGGSPACSGSWTFSATKE